MDSQVAALLQAQGGVVSTVQLAPLGVTPADLRACVSRGELVRLRRGAFVEADRWAAADPDERYRLRVMAVLRSRTADEAASHHSALALHRLPLWRVDRGLVVVTGDVAESTTSNGLRLTPLRRLVATTQVDGVESLAVADAVVTTAASCMEAGVVAADAALHDGHCRPADLAEAASRLRQGLRGRARLRRALANVDARAESPGESRTRLVLTALGLPVEPQVEIRDVLGAFVARVDFLVAGRVVVEFDGAVKYGGAAGRQELMAEKRREDRLRELGYQVVRITWDELARPGLVLARVRAALARRAA